MEGTSVARHPSAIVSAVTNGTMGRSIRFDYYTRYVHYCRYQSAQLPMMGYPFGSEDHRRNRERCEAVICADLNASMLFFESTILSMETYVHPTNLNRKTHGIRDTNTRTRLSTLMKPERA
ncbi:hypothetical protein T11_1279 [Trichinella zimbabwensis]|uniref:Uncharacterized protein n=1 Tax=Trichinella zimbabwensis TaxID=268475 RepID=A0A0V1I114_9BILA|nr:hypothetical protein T11_1279 [Trichinella zimbabwensis]